jgi:hypothetical protein
MNMVPLPSDTHTRSIANTTIGRAISAVKIPTSVLFK